MSNNKKRVEQLEDQLHTSESYTPPEIIIQVVGMDGSIEETFTLKDGYRCQKPKQD